MGEPARQQHGEGNAMHDPVSPSGRDDMHGADGVVDNNAVRTLRVVAA